MCQSQQVYIIKSLLARVIANFSGQTVLVCYVVKGPFAAMSRKIKLGTLQGSVITLDVPMTATVRELKMMFLLKHPCQDPLERKVLKVELLRDNSIIDDAESLDEAGLVGAEPPVTVTYARNEVEAVEQDDIHAQGYFGVKIPSNVTNISNAAFKDLHELVLVTIPESVTHIGECAFQDCDSLASITLGESVTDIGEGAFAGCTSLASITLGESVTVSHTLTQRNACQSCTLPNVNVSHRLTQTDAHCFSSPKNRSLETVSITSCAFVAHIGKVAFEDCTSLTSITLSESVTDIGESGFEGCTSLASITLPESLEHLLVGVFRGSSVAIITIPAKQGRKRLRNEWVSVQNLLCYHWLQSATCRKIM